MKILLVEDEELIREGMGDFLTAQGYTIVLAADGESGLEYFLKEKPDLVLLDIGLPGMSGLDLLKEIRKTSQVPCLMLTAYGDDSYQMEAFESLADGYMVKPFSLDLVKTRIEGLIKRYYGDSHAQKFGKALVDFNSYRAEVEGREVEMNPKEIEILKYLFENKGQALTRNQILDHVWSDEEDVPFDRVIDVYIKNIRKKLVIDTIKTIRNVGYRLDL